MAYTLANLTTFFTNANAGTAPTTAQTLTLTALANQNAAGTLTDVQAQAQTIDLAADITTSVGIETYAFFAGVAPSQAGIAAINAAFVGTGAQASLNGENRFIAQSIALATLNTTYKASFTASYGALSVADATKAAYNIIVGNTAAAAAGINIDAAVAYLTSAASIAYYSAFVKANTGLTAAADLDLAVKAAIIGEILYTSTTFNNGAGVGSYATATTNLLKDLADDGSLVANNTAGINLLTAYGATGTGTPGTPGTSQALKVGLDALVGTANDDTFVGSLDAIGATATTVNLGDSIDGGAGTDTLTIVSNITGGTSVSGLTLKNVENVVVNNTVAVALPAAPAVGAGAGTTAAGNTITVDASNFAGVSKISGSGVGDFTITNIGSVTLGVNGTTTNGAAGDATHDNTLRLQTITGAGAASVDVTGTTQSFGNLAIDTSGGTGTSLALRNTGSTAATVSTLKLGGSVTALNVAATSGITLNGTYSNYTSANNGTAVRDGNGIVEATPNTLKTITVSGVGAVSLGNVSSTALTSFDASASTGGVTAVIAGGAGLVTVKGSAGADTLTVTAALAATAAVDLGAGNDTLTLGAAPAATATINGGDGTDTLGVTGSGIVTSTNKAQFVSFEAIAISGTTTTYDVANLSTFANINVVGGSVQLTNVGANATFGATGTSASLDVFLASTTGTADNVNLTLGAATKPATISAYRAVGVENLTINSVNGTAAGSSTQTTNSLVIGAAVAAAAGPPAILANDNLALTNVTVTGNGMFTLNTAAASHALNVNATALTNFLVVTGGSAAQTLNVQGSAQNDTIVASDVGGAINAGKGGDSITLSTAVVGGVAGAGVDTIILKAGDSTLDLTTGNLPGANQKSAMDTIVNFKAGADKIDVSQVAGFVGSAQGVATATATDAASITALLATANVFKDAGSGLTRGVLDITATAGHYVAVDVNHDGSFQAGTDIVVLLTGLTGTLASTDFNFGS